MNYNILPKKTQKGGEKNMRTNVDDMKFQIKFVLCMFLFAVVCLLVNAFPAFAVTTPDSGFAQEVYDIAVTKILQGPIGFVCGVAAIAFGAVAAIKSQIMTAVPAVLGGAVLLKADTIVQSLGAIF